MRASVEQQGALQSAARARIKVMRYSESMATRSTKVTPRHAKASPKRSAQSKKGRSSDRRTTLRVPRALETEISWVSRELGISENQALVHLAALGAKSAQRERAVRQVTERRRTAISRTPSADAGIAFPSSQEMREAILIDRD